MPQQKLSPELLTAALDGLEVQKEQIDSHIAEVRRMLGVRPKGPTALPEAAKRGRKFSAASRRHIAAAQRKRWAEFRKQKAAAAKK